MRKQLLWAVAVALGLLGAAPLGMASGEAGETCATAGPDCCGNKVCWPTTKTWTRSRTKYDAVCEDFFKPPCCCCFAWLFGGKDCCGEKNCCGKVCTRKVLIIKVRKEEH